MQQGEEAATRSAQRKGQGNRRRPGTVKRRLGVGIGRR